ncbi:NCS2 family nucleobase:cation symporter-2 [Endobacter medicaginis]|uniref:NCS2 family nucleobase:cation symporter-2 n=1 Tax=Endobacter medicaginis TaxID=1181271 RepID=A0A839UYI1_9PROT|nr:nucleobase:cation symporter-2 family protein [Endobacter medicaginis]MBB3174836.1 NCS2 family nucleobase:cation symporter-2 [Endobacter medicaginis]MCX5475632.1 nucleobase:cation symporter-2 family protein [Endobacter medicaginis]NVN29118.1 purine permease [Endobacter medicaginis]
MTPPQAAPLPPARIVSLGLQHVMVMYAGTVAVPLIVASMIGLTGGQTALLVDASLLTSGLATLLQTLGLWRFGGRLPLIQGCSFVMLSPLVLIGQRYGLPTVFGSAIACGLFTILAAPLFGRLLRFFPPLVIGCVITIIGISLMPAAALWIGGGNPAAPGFGAPANLALGFATLALHCLTRGILRSFSILSGMIAGTLAALACGLCDFSAVGDAAWIGLATPFAFGPPRFAAVPVLVACLGMLVVMTETTGNVLLIDRLLGRETTPLRLADSLRADGLASVLGGCLNSFPYNAFSQNAGLMMLTGVARRSVLVAAGLILIGLGLFPKLGAIVAAIPRPVLGGAGILMFGMTLAAGIRQLREVDLDRDANMLVIAVSIGVGVLPMSLPRLFDAMPDAMRLILDSGIFLGGLAAVLLNALLNRKGSPRLD